MRSTKNQLLLASLASLSIVAACGPRAHIPPRGLAPIPGALSASDPDVTLAHSLAPTLYLQPEETFPLSRVVAVIHPTRPIISYHLLWRDDVHGAWIPFTVPTDEEVVWVGYDPVTRSPTDIWTYWHGVILHTDWRGKGAPAIDVQWGKHGSLPRGTALGDLPKNKSLNLFYALAQLGAPDIWLSNTMRKGPWCFCGSYASYRKFTKPLPTANRLDAVVRELDPRATLHAVFGDKYSRKPDWPDTAP